MLSIMRYINSEGSVSHCTSKAVVSGAVVQGGVLRAFTGHPRQTQTCSIGRTIDLDTNLPEFETRKNLSSEEVEVLLLRVYNNGLRPPFSAWPSMAELPGDGIRG
ncbi:hypothetical protein TNCV_367401 [Trichonephila clavipes]|nr:hypothetical protein TNCV_367401 [Trichonephila clavipes]